LDIGTSLFKVAGYPIAGAFQQMSEDTISNNPGSTALTNGGIRIVSAPAVPQYIPNSEGMVMEYLVAFPMYILDPRDWKPIECVVNGIFFNIERPIAVTTPYHPEKELGNEGAEAFCSIIRIKTPPGIQLEHHDGWKIVESLLQWIRVKCRHYWLLHGSAGVGALYRGTMFTRQGSKFTSQNIASYGPGVVVRPLTEEVWLSIREELENDEEVPLAETIYCDALLSVAGRNEMKALLEAGVAAEVAITQLLTEVSSVQPDSPGKADFREKMKADYPPFSRKLTEWPQRLGLEAATDFALPGIPSTWVQKVQELYRLRNGVAHAGERKSKSSALPTHVGIFIFAANALLEYCRSQRSRVGLRNYSMPAGSAAFEQIIVCHDGFLAPESKSLVCILGN
jgi:hypothetical protein